MSHNDRGMMNMSGLQDYLMSDGMLTANVGNDDTGFFYPCIFGDSIEDENRQEIVLAIE